MYLHIGEDILVKTDEVIAILDKQILQSSFIMREFLDRKKEMTVNLAKGSIKSIVVTNKHIYYSPLASVTLKKRSQQKTILINGS
ncbi:DUF370 domain-containing protein [Peribacillus cavernae]|uniref:DUF370 domain-containing protein n=1 Tax=Peribacillus cavernae TaxID=1674310 RepID=A0A3S0TW44_9BACI|nr:extracellular matrix/biofilm biosynthesis regulator RemA family protein [Peribacillus cavernae]MDQ0220932.1 hypothetical protein [Peribacillus cavernae]RUQ24539.1 DUF370 domain-containing protein [Peribacillus cavernae]